MTTLNTKQILDEVASSATANLQTKQILDEVASVGTANLQTKQIMVEVAVVTGSEVTATATARAFAVMIG